MLGGYGVFVQSQVGFQPVLSLLLLQLQASIKAFGHSSLYVLLLSVLFSLCVLTLCAMALGAPVLCALVWGTPHYLCSCFQHSSFCDFLLLAILALCAFALDIPHVLLLWTFLALCALAFNIPHFVNSCSQHSSLYVFLLLALLATFRVVGGSCC
jgi:hypothetical protein